MSRIIIHSADDDFQFEKRALFTYIINGGVKMPYKIQVRKIAIITVQISRLAKRISVLTEANGRRIRLDVITLKIVRKNTFAQLNKTVFDFFSFSEFFFSQTLARYIQKLIINVNITFTVSWVD